MAQYFSPVWSGRLALIASAGLALLVVWLLVRLAWLAIAGPQVESAPVPQVPPMTQVASSGEAFRWDLFGSERAPTQVVQAVSPARSGLRLLGIMSGGPRAYAIIADSQGRENVYRVGDELPDGTRLDNVEAQRIIVVRNGRAEALELDQNRSGGPAAPASQPPAQAQSQPQSQDSTSFLSGVPSFTIPSGASVASLPGMAGTGGLDASALASSISVMPVAGGGFRVRPGRDATLFAELGLQVNDIVLAVNGQPLETEEAARALFTDIMQRREIAITINRQGREMTLRPDLEQIMGSQ